LRVLRVVYLGQSEGTKKVDRWVERMGEDWESAMSSLQEIEGNSAPVLLVFPNFFDCLRFLQSND
jgi:hypothetical protein